MKLTIEVFSDVICPWCFIGKRRLEKALRSLGKENAARVTWRPFQLNPAMPKVGMDRKVYRTAKFGSWERSQALDKQVVAAGANEEIPFDFERIQRTPNTFNAHLLIWLGRILGVQDAIVEGLFRNYFLDGFDLSNKDVLLGVARTNGIDTKKANTFIENDEAAVRVGDEEARAHRMGISSVPCFIVNGKYTIVGAQSPDLLVSVFRQAMEEKGAVFQTHLGRWFEKQRS
jgi:predicted DsbA family dithiol-disulfide isomerase